jgi:hypothetical protein
MPHCQSSHLKSLYTVCCVLPIYSMSSCETRIFFTADFPCNCDGMGAVGGATDRCVRLAENGTYGSGLGGKDSTTERHNFMVWDP